MESAGEEKRVQALFHELRQEDEQTAISFAATWNRAVLKSERPRRGLTFVLAAVSLLLLCSLITVALWSRRSSIVPQTPVSYAPAPPAPSPAHPEKTSESQPGLVVQRETPRKQKVSQFVARHNPTAPVSTQTEISQAAAISSWKSPTSALMGSSSQEVFSSLPQLNENANELKSFLPSSPK